MLSKLLKYELKATGRIMLPLYLILFAATLALSVNIRFTSNASSTGNFIFSTILIILFVVSILMVGIVSVLLILQRFYKNLLGNEGYLMFSLPVSTAQNISSKGLTALIWIIASILAGIVCGITMVSVVGDFSEFWSQVQEIWTAFVDAYGKGKTVLYVVLFILMVIFSLLEGVFKVYASIAVGHQWGGHRVLGSVLAYAGFSVIEMVLSFMPFHTGRRWSSMMVSYGEHASNRLFANLPEFTPLLIISLIGIVVYGLITWILLDRRLNLE